MSRYSTAVALIACFSAATSLAAHKQQDAVLYKAVESHHDEALRLLESLVDTDSGSRDIDGAKRMHAIVSERLSKLGMEVRYEPAEAPNLAPNLVAVAHGSGKTRILIIAHLDTVFGPGDAAKHPFTIQGTRALGAGVGDEKGGVVNALMALTLLHEENFRGYGTITLLLDGSEELASPGSTALIKRLAQQHDVVLNMEPGDPPDSVTVWRKGGGQISMKVKGRAAHAGVVPQNGRNAAVELLHQLASVEGKFPHVGDGTTLNLTVLKAGDRTNIIPDLAEAIFDVRYRDLKEMDAVVAAMRAGIAPPAISDTSVSVDTQGSAYPPLANNSQTMALGKAAQDIYAELGRSLGLAGNGGASESAIAQSEGIPTLDGLGYVGGDFHTDHEWIDLETVTPRMYLMARLLQELSHTAPRR